MREMREDTAIKLGADPEVDHEHGEQKHHKRASDGASELVHDFVVHLLVYLFGMLCGDGLEGGGRGGRRGTCLALP